MKMSVSSRVTRTSVIKQAQDSELSQVRIVEGQSDFFDWMMDISNPIGFPANHPDTETVFSDAFLGQDSDKDDPAL